MEDKTGREDVAQGLAFSIHVCNVNDLRSHVARSATSHEQIVLLFSPSGQSEVDNHHLARVFVSQHNVLGFQVAVHDSL